MRILILGAGKMGTFLTDVLSFQHETAVFDTDPQKLRFVYHTYRFTNIDEIREFNPELVINAVTLKYTFDAFDLVLPALSRDCIISSLGNLSSENAIIIKEGDHMGRIFFKDLYQNLHLNIFEYSFDEHDETVAYSLSIPFVSTFVFSAVMKHQDAPGTTFKKHMAIAQGVLNEDDYLLQEILFNPRTMPQVENIRRELKELLQILSEKDADGFKQYLSKIRGHVLR